MAKKSKAAVGPTSLTNVHLWADKSPTNAPAVLVVWRDIQAISHWNDEAEEISPARQLQTIGYFLYEGPDPHDEEHDMIVIAQTFDPSTNKWSDYTCFPREVVRQIVVIKKPRKK